MYLLMSFVSSPMKPLKPDVKTFKYYGDTPPLNYFDPLHFNSGDIDESRIKWWREAELNHGRTAMLAAIALPVLQVAHPESSGIDYLSNLPVLTQSPFWLGMACYEFSRINVGFKAPNSGNAFSLLETYQPGNLLQIDPENISETKYNQELNNGRLAMLACAHFLVTGLISF